MKQGELIGKMGLSGSTGWWVHIHYELRNNIGFVDSEGLPSYFNNFNRILGKETIKVNRGSINTGEIVKTEV